MTYKKGQSVLVTTNRNETRGFPQGARVSVDVIHPPTDGEINIETLYSVALEKDATFCAFFWHNELEEPQNVAISASQQVSASPAPDAPAS